MLFSVIIPAYNAEDKISKSINSVLKQTFTNFEVIVVNDGSTDSTKQILNEFSKVDSRVKVINQDNHGPYAARKIGIQRAIGEYILFLDADDYFESNLMEEMVPYTVLKMDMILFKWRIINTSGKISKTEPIFKDGTIFEGSNKNLIYKKLICTFDLNSLCTKAVRKELFNEKTFILNEKIINGEDLIVCVPIITHANRIIYIDKELYNYVRNNTSTTQNFVFSYYRSRKIINQILTEYLKFWNLNTLENKQIIDSRFLRDTINAIPGRKEFKALPYKSLLHVKKIARDDFFQQRVNQRNISNLKFIDKLFLLGLKHNCIRLSILLNTFRLRLRRINNITKR